MKNWLKTGAGAVLTAVVLASALAPAISEAKRLGGGKSLGMQRSAPPTAPAATPHSPPVTPAANPAPPAGPMAGAAAAAPRRSWMGPLAGLAAGIGIGALLSHLGMGGLGAGFANLLTFALLALVVFFVVRFLMQRFARGQASPGLRFAGVGNAPTGGFGANGWAAPARGPTSPQQPLQRAEPAGGAAFGPGSGSVAPVSGATPMSTTTAATTAAVPPGFDTEGFERIAKMIFIRLQAANDKADLGDLRTFTTPEMFAAIRLDLQDRGASAQQTDVVEVHPQVIEVATDGGRQVVSVRFHGLIREDLNQAAEPFDEVWHLVKPAGSPDSGWAISGIQQRQ